MSELNDLYQEVILEHNKNPRNFREIAGADRTADGNNPLCGDALRVYLDLENDRIKDVAFKGSGCAISKASASMMTQTVKGKTKEEDEKADVAELMSFEHDTAGGLMTTEFVTFPKNLTVGEAILRLREMAETPNMIYYLYIVEEENSWKLIGLITLRTLILADPTYTLEQVMRDQFQFAHPSDSVEEVAQKISEYNLLALPVIDDEGDIAGIVTVDDAMEILLPKNLNKRLPRLFG